MPVQPVVDVVLQTGVGLPPAPTSLAVDPVNGPPLDVLAGNPKKSADFGDGHMRVLQEFNRLHLLPLSVALVGAPPVRAPILFVVTGLILVQFGRDDGTALNLHA